MGRCSDTEGEKKSSSQTGRLNPMQIQPDKEKTGSSVEVVLILSRF